MLSYRSLPSVEVDNLILVIFGSLVLVLATLSGVKVSLGITSRLLPTEINHLTAIKSDVGTLFKQREQERHWRQTAPLSSRVDISIDK